MDGRPTRDRGGYSSAMKNHVLSALTRAGVPASLLSDLSELVLCPPADTFEPSELDGASIPRV